MLREVQKEEEVSKTMDVLVQEYVQLKRQRRDLMKLKLRREAQQLAIDDDVSDNRKRCVLLKALERKLQVPEVQKVLGWDYGQIFNGLAILEDMYNEQQKIVDRGDAKANDRAMFVTKMETDIATKDKELEVTLAEIQKLRPEFAL